MIQKKLCMIGAFATGKTSLVGRFVSSIFSDKYLTTVGVKICKKELSIGGQRLSLVLWDLHGEDEFQKVRMSYLRGSAAYMLVVDGTRRATLDTAFALQKEVEDALGSIPFAMLLNKSDLAEEWDIETGAIDEAMRRGWLVIRTSAKTGQGVQEAFLSLAGKMIEA